MRADLDGVGLCGAEGEAQSDEACREGGQGGTHDGFLFSMHDPPVKLALPGILIKKEQMKP
jgi:hypothetical protein